MIPQSAITGWKSVVSWRSNEQVEQDLIICRSLVELYSDEFLTSNLAFRGGTALYKLFLQTQPRYSEDIDLVQIKGGPGGEIIDRLKVRLSFLGVPVIKQKESNNKLIFKFDSEIPPIQKLRLKVEINCREHFTVLGWFNKEFSIHSSWFTGTCNMTTYRLEELAGTKLRALYQRRKGRDLHDLYKVLVNTSINADTVIQCYRKYMEYSVDKPPSRIQFLRNLEEKIIDPEFLGDTTALLSPTEQYDPLHAYDIVRSELIEKI